MANNTGGKWQPFADQFPYACRVCRHGEDTALTVRCRYCKTEEKPGFEFDPDMYLGFIKSMEDKIRMLKSETRPACDLKEDRDFWKNLAEAALRRLY